MKIALRVRVMILMVTLALGACFSVPLPVPPGGSPGSGLHIF